MKWELVNIKPERLNGLKLRVAQTTPETTVPKLLDHLLEEAGISQLTEQELDEGIKQAEVIAE